MDHHENLVASLGKALQQKGWVLAVAESCTGGMLSEKMTALSGSSAWFECGFITYSNASKIRLLNVKESTLNQHGAVSEETAVEMALGTLKNSQANISVSITGIAGPTGGTAIKPVGLVCFAWADSSGTLTKATQHFQGNREQIRAQATNFALSGLLSSIQKQN